MKHRFINKKTGAEAQVLAIYLDSDGVMQIDDYDTVEDLANDYTAYEKYKPPKEPLIKDKKIRKAVRAWAKANGFREVIWSYADKGVYSEEDSLIGVYFGSNPIDEKADIKKYTIEELCGEEEE